MDQEEEKTTDQNPIHQIEGIKLVYDYVKHLTTLNVASIVILAAFADNVQSLGHLKPLGIVALSGFGVSIVFCMVVNLVYVGKAERADFQPPTGVAQTIGAISFLLATLGFVIALSSLAVFAGRNFLG